VLTHFSGARSLEHEGDAPICCTGVGGSTTSSGYKVSLQKLKIHSMQIQGDNL